MKTTVNFWVCVALALINLTLFFVNKHIGAGRGAEGFNLLVACFCGFGAWIHWLTAKAVK